jgi:hypothetical protein
VELLGLEAEIGRIDDPQTIVQMGIFSLPQLMIDGQLVQFRYRGRRSIEEVLAKLVQSSRLNQFPGKQTNER